MLKVNEALPGVRSGCPMSAHGRLARSKKKATARWLKKEGSGLDLDDL